MSDYGRISKLRYHGPRAANRIEHALEKENEKLSERIEFLESVLRKVSGHAEDLRWQRDNIWMSENPNLRKERDRWVKEEREAIRETVFDMHARADYMELCALNEKVDQLEKESKKLKAEHAALLKEHEALRDFKLRVIEGEGFIRLTTSIDAEANSLTWNDLAQIWSDAEELLNGDNDNA